MKFAPNSMSAIEARAMLDHIPELYSAILKNTQVEQPTGNEVYCSFELPVLGKRTKVAPTVREAIRAVLLELADVLTTVPMNDWPDSWRRLTSSTLAEIDNCSETSKSKRFQAKARQFTIGVTMPMNLKKSLDNLAEQQLSSFAEVARQFVAMGFEDFDDRSFSEGSKSLLSLLSSEINKWQPSESEQVMVRLDHYLAVRIRSAAKEYSRSASEFGAMCLAHGLELQAQLVNVEQKVAAYRGAPVRDLAIKIGLGKHAALLSGILVGSIVAPKRVLERLSEVLDTSILSLTTFFKQSFEHRAIPAFKAENGKPHVVRRVVSWEEAVKSLNLTSEDSRVLLQLDE